jgi:serine protease Do
MGYSISSNIAKPILEELMNRPSRPALGIFGQTVTEDFLRDMGYYDIPPMGVVIDRTIRSSGAEKAGLQHADIITGFNGRPIFTMEQLIEEIRQCQINERVEIRLLREGREVMTIHVTLGEMTVNNF